MWQRDYRKKTFLQQVRGWTLIELVVVLVIVALLASLSFASLRGLSKPSHRYQVQAYLLELARELEQNYRIANQYTSLQTDSYPPSDPTYTVSLTISSDKQTFTLSAVPLGKQQDDGALELDSDGNRRHYLSDQATGEYVSW